MSTGRNDVLTRIVGLPVVYFVEAVGLERIKIGTTTNVPKRLAALSAQSPVPFEFKLHGIVMGSKHAERRYWRKYPEPRLYGEWFSFTEKGRAWLSSVQMLNLDTLLSSITVDDRGHVWYWPE